MDDVSLMQQQTHEKELDNLIFHGEDDDEDEFTIATNPNTQPQITTETEMTNENDSDENEEKKATGLTKSSDRSSLNNVLPVEKLKNGATTASKVLGQTFSMFKEKSGAALEAAKSSNAGKTIAGGLNTAATAGQEQYGKLKGTDAFKKSTTLASGAYERTSLVASGALEKARAASSSGLEMAKHTAAASIETIKSKTGSKKGGEE